MAKPASSNTRAVTANRLRDGAVVFRTLTGGWSSRIADAETASSEADAARLLAQAEHDAATAVVVGPYLIDVAEIDGELRPTSLRERIRAYGPTTPIAGVEAVPYL
jgi:histidinol dehydrogenase